VINKVSIRENMVKDEFEAILVDIKSGSRPCVEKGCDIQTKQNTAREPEFTLHLPQ